jgi:predicted RNA-binding protein YlxR (DUF448 family)
MRKPKHVPERTCVGCRRKGAKGSFVRIVRTPNGELRVDQGERLAGRGAYLCAQPSCLQQALQRQALQRALRVTLDEEATKALCQAWGGEPGEEGSASSPNS